MAPGDKASRWDLRRLASPSEYVGQPHAFRCGPMSHGQPWRFQDDHFDRAGPPARRSAHSRGAPDAGAREEEEGAYAPTGTRAKHPKGRGKRTWRRKRRTICAIRPMSMAPLAAATAAISLAGMVRIVSTGAPSNQSCVYPTAKTSLALLRNGIALGRARVCSLDWAWLRQSSALQLDSAARLRWSRGRELQTSGARSDVGAKRLLALDKLLLQRRRRRVGQILPEHLP